MALRNISTRMRRVATFIAGRAVAHWNCAMAERELRALTDALLADIGMRRHEIGAVCRARYLGHGKAGPDDDYRSVTARADVSPPAISIGTEIWCTVYLLGPH
jgi:uncharacterized protein YjiS (DUF1127 family)